MKKIIIGMVLAIMALGVLKTMLATATIMLTQVLMLVGLALAAYLVFASGSEEDDRS